MPRLSRAFRPHVEQLEGRTLLTARIALSGGVISVVGTPGDDRFSVHEATFGGEVRYFVSGPPAAEGTSPWNGADSSFLVAEVTGNAIIFQGLDGNDEVTNRSRLNLTVRGARG